MLAVHYAEVGTIPLIVSTMGPCPLLVSDIPHPADPKAPLHPFYMLPLAYPPSHSPFVISFEQQRAQLAAQVQASQQQVEAFFPASFEAPIEAPAPVLTEREHPPVNQDGAKVEAASVPEPQHEQGSQGSQNPLASLPVKDREKKLRMLSGNRRDSIKNIAAMREQEAAAELAEKRAAAVKVLEGTSREDLIEEILFLRKRVASLETQLGSK